jgi:hypothetical protein
MSIEHGKYAYMHKDGKVGISISKARVVGLDDTMKKHLKEL